MKKIRIGLLGLGQIGSGFYALCQAKKDFFRRGVGVDLQIHKVAVRNRHKKRSLRIPSRLITTNTQAILQDSSIDVIVELIGGTRDAYQYVIEALKQGKHVVTANKALLAEYGDEIFTLANKMKRWVFFEASVGGGIPVIKALREGLVANQIDSIYAIINGTSNYILTRMTAERKDFKGALKEAQQKGYAELDPRLDIEGIDAGHKLAILVRFAFGGKVRFSNIYCEGISRILNEDIAFAQEFGYRIKLLAIAKKAKDGIEARVQPTLLPQSHILSNVNESFNAVLIHGDEVGDVLLYGRGAGARPTASAVMSDLIDLAKKKDASFEAGSVPMRAIQRNLKIKNISSILSRYYLRFHIVDRPGVLAKISQVLGQKNISISDVIQKERSVGNIVPLILLTHDAHESDVRSAMRIIEEMHVVRGKAQVLRIENH